MLARIDAVADATGAAPETRTTRIFSLGSSPTTIDLRAEGIGTVLWAIGYARDYSWLNVPALDAAGELIHDGGITPSPGLYVIGLRYMRRRRSNFIDGVGLDAADLAEHLDSHLARLIRAAA